MTMNEAVVSTVLAKIPTGLEVADYISNLPASDIYKNAAIQRKGVTVEGTPVTEVIAEFLLHNDLLAGIQTITRDSCYDAGHSKELEIPESNREEILAMKIYKNCSWAIDYQVPLKNKREDGAGKIDLLLQEANKLILGELKIKKSEESLLRAVLEVETYWRTLDRDKLLKDFSNTCSNSVAKAIIIFKNSRQFRELCDPKYKMTQQLISKYGIYVILADELEKQQHIVYYK